MLDMKRQVLVLRCLLAMPGVALLLTSAMLLGTGVFGTARFTLGLGMHLLGQGLCVGALCLPSWLAARKTAQAARQQAMQAGVQEMGVVRPAHFRLSVQALRLLCGLAFLALMVYCGLAGIGQLRNLLLLQQSGETTNATITGTSYREDKPLMNVTYSFTLRGSLPITDSFRAPRSLIGQMQTGNLLSVTYLPASPDVHSWQPVDLALIRQRVLAGLMLLAALLAYLGLPLLILERRLRRQLRLARLGTLVTGTIVACKPLAWRGRRRGYSLVYTYTLPSGNVWSHQAFVPHVEGEPTLPGFSISVLYDAAQPSVSLPLAAFHAVQLVTLRKSYLVA